MISGPDILSPKAVRRGRDQRFWDEIDRHIAWIADNAKIPPLRDDGYRRVNLKVSQ